LAERLGGDDALRATIAGLYARILSDPSLAPFFADVDVSLLQIHQLTFFRIAYGNIPDDLDVPKLILEKHSRLFSKGLNVTHFDKVAGHLFATLKELGVEQSLINECLAAVGPLRHVFAVAKCQSKK
jgi:hemoglobin